jgi:exo-1,4-beta-D-glucosaminidase
MQSRKRMIAVATLASATLAVLWTPNAAAEGARLSLREWRLQTSVKVDASGAAISSVNFGPAKSWYAVQVPTTVTAALVKQKVYPDPYFGMNLRSFPGVSYPAGANFSILEMNSDSPFAVSWWYRTEFTLPAADADKTIWLNFGGLNYRANIWLNGKQIANSDDVAGAWRTWEFDITAAAKPGAVNTLAVQVWAPKKDDLAITFVDWNPNPPDKNMGLWRSVYVTTSGPVAVRYPAVISEVNSPANDSAAVTATAVLKNASNHAVQGKLRGKIENISFEQDVELAPGESKDISFEPNQYPQLKMANPKLWWPAQMGAQNFYPLEMEFETDGKVSDRVKTHFAVRQVTGVVDEKQHRVFTINGKKILIRGGGWSPDMMLRENPARLEDEIRYTRDMGLNTIRLEGKLETEEFFDLTDRYGLLVMAGWCCCDHWEHWQDWKEQDFKISAESLRDQALRLRNHPSVFVWLYGSDGPPPPDVEQNYLTVLKQCRWPNPSISSAKNVPTPVTGDPGVKMNGPYDYVAPSYWMLEKESIGGAWSFNTETSMGPAVPPVESLREMLPKEKLWPVNEVWDYHSGGGPFKTIGLYKEAVDKRFGPSDNVEDFARKSQIISYEGERAMFEAFSRNKYNSTGVVQWMLNNAWPSVIWHLYDFYLRPGGGYFGTKIACEPLHPVYGYDDNAVWLVSSQYTDANGLKVSARVLNLDMTEKFSKEVTVDAGADSTQKLIDLPQIDGLSATYFLVLTVNDTSGKRVGSNLYWLSTKPEKLDWEKSTWYMTPTSDFADFTALNTLPTVKLKVASKTEHAAGEVVTHVTIENPSKSIAFFNRLKLTGAKGEEVLPVIWQDNYFSLLPGEKRDVTATYHAKNLGAAKPVVVVEGWNAQ